MERADGCWYEEWAEWREQVVAGKIVQVIGDTAWKKEPIALAAAVVVLANQVLEPVSTPPGQFSH